MSLKDNNLRNIKKVSREPLPKLGKKFPQKEKSHALIALLKHKYEKYLFQCRVIH